MTTIKSFEDFQKQQSAETSGLKRPRYRWAHDVLAESQAKARADKPSPLLEAYMANNPSTKHLFAKRVEAIRNDKKNGS